MGSLIIPIMFYISVFTTSSFGFRCWHCNEFNEPASCNLEDLNNNNPNANNSTWLRKVNCWKDVTGCSKIVANGIEETHTVILRGCSPAPNAKTYPNELNRECVSTGEFINQQLQEFNFMHGDRFNGLTVCQCNDQEYCNLGNNLILNKVIGLMLIIIIVILCV